MARVFDFNAERTKQPSSESKESLDRNVIQLLGGQLCEGQGSLLSGPVKGILTTVANILTIAQVYSR